MGLILAQTSKPILEAADREIHTAPKIHTGQLPAFVTSLDTTEDGHQIIVETGGAAFTVPLPYLDELGKNPALLGVGSDGGAVIAYLVGNRNRAFAFDTGLRVGNDTTGGEELRGETMQLDVHMQTPEDFRAMVREEVAEGIRAITANQGQMAQMMAAAPAPAVTTDTAILAAQVANALLLGPPADDHYDLPANARFNTRIQETFAIMLVNQAFWQEVIKAIDQAFAGLRVGGYQPPR